MKTVLLLLGANLGDRERRLRRALIALKKIPGCYLRRISHVYETAAIGHSRKSYLNLAVWLDTSRTPMGLLLEAKSLEAAAGRKVGRRWSARPLDIDLIAHGRTRLRTPWLTIPHPLVAERAFALAPLAEIAPNWKPRSGRTVRSWLSALNPDPRIVKLWPNDRRKWCDSEGYKKSIHDR